jgi:hypothetical protein
VSCDIKNYGLQEEYALKGIVRAGHEYEDDDYPWPANVSSSNRRKKEQQGSSHQNWDGKIVDNPCLVVAVEDEEWD